MLNFVDGYKATLLANLSTTADKLSLCQRSLNAFRKFKDGDYVYLTLKYLDRVEVVRFTKDGELSGGLLPVDRDVLQSGRKNFPKGACVTIEWNSIQLHEFICQTKCGGAANERV